MNFFRKILVRLNLRQRRKNFIKCLGEESMDGFLETLLRLMDVYFVISRKFRKNIKNFNARYALRSIDGRIDASIIFKDSKMKVKNHIIDNTNVTLVFKDGKALKNFLFADNPDIIGAILKNEVSYTGNLNYIAKFAYMAKHLKLQFAPDK